MTEQEMRDRTKAFSVRVMKVVFSLPKSVAGDVLGRQLLRCATSVGANYRAARRARSTAEFIYKLGIVEEEADEAAYWLELLVESGLVKAARLSSLQDECEQILAIIVATIRTAKRRK